MDILLSANVQEVFDHEFDPLRKNGFLQWNSSTKSAPLSPISCFFRYHCQPHGLPFMLSFQISFAATTADFLLFLLSLTGSSPQPGASVPPAYPVLTSESDDDPSNDHNISHISVTMCLSQTDMKRGFMICRKWTKEFWNRLKFKQKKNK